MNVQTPYLAAINRAIDWIGANLAGDTSLQTVARVAGFSSFHFHRVFTEATGETLHAFVMRLRFERAISLLRTAPGKSLTSIALDAGFGSSSSLARAFAQRFSIKPSALRSRSAMQIFLTGSYANASRAAVEVKLAAASEPLSDPLKASLRIEQWPALPFAYVRIFAAYLKPEALVAGYRAIEDWADAESIGRARSRLIGMSIDDPAVVPADKCRYDFCRESSIRPKARSGVNYNTLAACTWAILPCRGGLAAVDRCWTYLFRDWLPRSGWQPAALPALEVFHQRPEEIGWDNFDLDCCLPLEARHR